MEITKAGTPEKGESIENKVLKILGEYCNQ